MRANENVQGILPATNRSGRFSSGCPHWLWRSHQSGASGADRELAFSFPPHPRFSLRSCLERTGGRVLDTESLWFPEASPGGSGVGFGGCGTERRLSAAEECLWPFRLLRPPPQCPSCRPTAPRPAGPGASISSATNTSSKASPSRSSGPSICE